MQGICIILTLVFVGIHYVFKEEQNQVLGGGGRVRVYKLLPEAPEKLARFMKHVVWGSQLPAESHNLVREKLAEAGIDLDQELSKRGRDKAPNSASVKADYGDLAEVIGYHIETEIDGSSARYVWARNIHSKIVSRVSLPGIDGLAIRIDDQPFSVPLASHEWLKICEWKHTEDPSLAVPARRSAEYLIELTLPKLVQELKQVAADLTARGEDNRAVRVYLLAVEFSRKSSNVKLACAVLGPENTDSLSELEQYYINVLQKEGWAGNVSCGDAVLVQSVGELAKTVYEQFTH